MKFEEFSVDQHEQVRAAVSQANYLTGYAAALATCLQYLFSAEVPKTQWGIDFVLREDNLSADIVTPFGKARGIFVVQLIDGVLQGRYIVEKLVTSDLGTELWRPVWMIRVCQDGYGYAGDEGKTAIGLFDVNPTHHHPSLMKFALSISYAIAAEPGYFR